MLDALAGRNTKRAPVWLMRQAGRYSSSYQKLRGKYSLKDLFFTPELAAEVTLLPIQELGVDAAILFSDITVIAIALGLALDFQEGPIIHPLLKTIKDVENLVCLDVKETLSSVGKTVALAKSHVPLIGFCGGPFTVASYLIEKHSGAELHRTKEWLQKAPENFHLLLGKITKVSIEYLQMQVENGADAIQIFDSWAHVLTEEEFQTFCLPYWKQLLNSVSVPGIVFGRKNALRVQSIATIKPSAISIDWHLPISQARKQVKLPLQGNLDPDLLFSPLHVVQQKTIELLDSMKGDPGFIVNLGHGIKPKTPFEAVKCLVDTVKSYAD